MTRRGREVDARQAPTWAVVAAWTTVWCTVPSCAWRVAAGFGVDVGFTGRLGERYHGPSFVAYVWILTVLSQAAAFLTLGLVRPWGERIASWVPRLGGRSIPAFVVIGAGLAGGLAVTGLCLAVAVAPHGPLSNPDFPQGTARTVMVACYAPLLVWGPLVLALTVAYARRRNGAHHGEAHPGTAPA